MRLGLLLLFGSIIAAACGDVAVQSEPLYGHELEVGDCTNLPARDRDGFRIMPCTQRHGAQVYAIPTVGDESDGWPGDLIVSIRADDACYEAFPKHLSTEGGVELGYTYFFPNEEGWEIGLRTAQCLLESLSDEPLNESVLALVD